jgi:restriction system protein
MGRRKRQQDNSLVALVGVALCIYILYELVTQNLPIVIFLFVVVGLIATFAVILPARRNRRTVFEKANDLIEQKADLLAKRRAQLVRQDPYGKPLLDKWHAEIDYFIAEHIRPRLSVKQQSILERERGEIVRLIMLCAENQTERSPVFKAFSETMTPTEFEAFCAEQLQVSGWDARLTRTTGDQGVDVIAEINGLRVVLQCKLYSGSVGNSAIQEIVAGKAYERADRCVVVTNSRYTPAAEQLAATNRVLLLHYSELPLLETLLQRHFPESLAHAYTPNLFAAAKDVDNPVPAVEAIQNELPLEPIPAERSWHLDKRVWIIGGAIVVVMTTLLFSRGTQQKAAIIDNRVTTATLPRQHQSTTPEFTTYTNNNFGFRIGYPTAFITKSTTENGDGIALASPDGEASLFIAGANTNGSTLSDLYNNSLKHVSGELGYHKVGGDWFVLTWKDGDRVFYQKVFVGSGAQNWFLFTFPANQRSTYEPITTRIEKSFRPGALDGAR